MVFSFPLNNPPSGVFKYVLKCVVEQAFNDVG
jgi:hypothetical protein